MYDSTSVEIQKLNDDPSITSVAAHNPMSIMTKEEYRSMLGYNNDYITSEVEKLESAALS